MNINIKVNNKTVDWLNSKIKSNQGFIMLNNTVMIASLFALVMSLMIILKAMTTSLIFFVDTWAMQSETQRILEDIVTEIRYADNVEIEQEQLNRQRIIITTRRRATILPDEKPKYIAYRNGGLIIYRQELSRESNGILNVKSTQPLNSNSFWGNNNMQFSLKKLDDKLYQINIQAEGYKSGQSFFMQTIVLQRNSDTEEKEQKLDDTT